MAAPAIQSNAVTKEGTGATSITGTKPSGASSGDLLVACLCVDGAPTPTGPTGWTQVGITRGGAHDAQIWRADGAVADMVWNWTGTEQGIVGIVRITGHDAATPVDVQTENQGTSDTATCNSPGSTSVDECLVLRFVGTDDDDVDEGTGYPAAHTGVFATNSNTGSGTVGVACAWEEQASAGDPGSADFALAASTAYAGFSLAIKPGAAPADIVLFRRRIEGI